MSNGGRRNGGVVEETELTRSHVVALLALRIGSLARPEVRPPINLLHCTLSLKRRSDPSLHKGIIREMDDQDSW